jgi:prepilin-type N-terminal cleavage/methylation domain-containing protein
MTKMKRFNASSGFTLIELLLVIAIIGILAGVMLAVINPAEQQNKARDGVTVSVLNKLGLAIGGYVSAYGVTPTWAQLTALSQQTLTPDATPRTAAQNGAVATLACAATGISSLNKTCGFTVGNTTPPSPCRTAAGTANLAVCEFVYDGSAGTTFDLYAPAYGGFIYNFDSNSGTITKI